MVNYLNASLADANTLTGGVDASGYLERVSYYYFLRNM